MATVQPPVPSEKSETARAAVKTIQKLSQELLELDVDLFSVDSPVVVNTLGRMQFAMTAAAFSTLSVGQCSIDGEPLTFRGRKEGLYVCCSGVPEHCWPV